MWYVNNYAVQSALTPLTANHKGFLGTITASIKNSGSIVLVSVDDNTTQTTLDPGEYIPVRSVADLNKLQASCSVTGQILKIQGTTDTGW